MQTEANGLPREGNLYQIEGIDDDERTGLLQIIIPPAEAISAVDISTNNFEAELGRATGAVTNVTLKSGTNSIHGSLFEFIQNNDLNARSYFSADRWVTCRTTTSAARWADRSRRTSCFTLATICARRITKRFPAPSPFLIRAISRLLQHRCPAAAIPTGCIDLSAAMNGTKGQIYDPTSYSDGTVHDGTAADPRPAFPNNQMPYSLVKRFRSRSRSCTSLNAAAAKYGTLTTKPLNNPANDYTTNLPFTKTTDSFDLQGRLHADREEPHQRPLQLSESRDVSAGGVRQHFSAALREVDLRVRAIRSRTAPASTTTTSFRLRSSRKRASVWLTWAIVRRPMITVRTTQPPSAFPA